MLIQSATTDKIQIITDVACTVDVHASWVDYSAGTVTPGRTNTAITTATTTDIVAAPASSTQRNVKTLNIRNKHATNAVTVTVQFNQNATLFELHKVTLFSGEVLEYVEGVGFFSLTADRVSVKRLTSDQNNSTTTPTKLSGLTVTTGIGSYKFEYHVVYRSTSTGTGVKFSVDHTGTLTSIVYLRMYPDASAAASTAAPDQDQVQATASVMGVFAGRVKSQAGLGTTLSVDTADTDMYEIIVGLMTVSVAGDIDLWHGSETAAQTTVKAGTGLILTYLGA